MPVDIGSATHRTAAAVKAASAALPPCVSMRSAAIVASGWLDAAIARAATAGGRVRWSPEPAPIRGSCHSCGSVALRARPSG
jgi:hypothetical protein